MGPLNMVAEQMEGKLAVSSLMPWTEDIDGRPRLSSGSDERPLNFAKPLIGLIFLTS